MGDSNEVKTEALSDIAEFRNGKPYEKNIDPHGRYSLITLDSIDINGNLKDEHKHIDSADITLSKGDIVTVLSDLAHGDLLGLSAVIPEDGTYVLNQRMGRLRMTRPGDPRYLRLQINFRQSHFKQRGQGTSQRHIYERDFSALAIPFPEPDEQRRIAESISNAEGWVRCLEQLIRKKRLIMQGAMQELLTGKRRLPGFDEKWVERPLSELADIRSGGTPSTSKPGFWNGGIPWCTPTDITSLEGRKYLEATAETISKSGLNSSSAELLPALSVLMTSRATIGVCAINKVPCATNQGFKNFIPTDVNAEFLYYLLQTQRSKFIALAGGSTFLEIGKAQLRDFLVTLPNDKNEQEAIGGVLSDMDDEIEALETKLEKARNIKQGMMQQLLTGKVRLV